MEGWAVEFANELKVRANPEVIGSVLGTVVSPPPELKISILEGRVFINEVYVLESALREHRIDTSDLLNKQTVSVGTLNAGDEVLITSSPDNQKFFCLGRVSKAGG